MDIVGPFKKAPGSKRYLLVTTDYFTKWVDAKALVNITANLVRKFLWEDIICLFGFPHAMVSDNGAQFNAMPIVTIWRAYRIQQKNLAPYNPKGNGQAEATNKTLLATMKK